MTRPQRLASISIVGTIALAIIAHATVVTFTESFNTTTYKDATNTTADWNTAAGELRLFPFVASEVGNYDTPGTNYSVVVSGNFALAGDAGGGMRILDITNTSNPTLIATYGGVSTCYGLVAANDRAYIADGGNGLAIVSIAIPSSPASLGTIATSDARGVAVVGALALVADNTAGLRLVDVSNPAAPVLLGTYDTPGEAMAVATAGMRAYVADGSAGLQVIDIANPASPVLLGSYNTPGNALGVAVHGTTVFVADGASGLHAIDVHIPSTPTLTGSFDTPGNAEGVFVAGDRAYVADGASGLRAINITNPASMAALFDVDTPGTAHAVAVDGTDALVADDGRLRVIAVGDPGFEIVGQLDEFVSPPSRIVVSGDVALLSDESGVRVVDISDPTSPSVVAHVDAYPSNAAISGHIAAITGAVSGFGIYDLSNPSSPVLLGSYSGTWVRGIDIAGNLVYVTTSYYPYQMQIIDISNPSLPTLVSSTIAIPPFTLVKVDGKVAYVYGNPNYYPSVIDVSNAAAPAVLTDLPVTAGDLCIVGSTVYAVSEGLFAVNMVFPANPQLETIYFPQPFWYSRGVAASGNHVLVATDTGLWSIDVTVPTQPILRSHASGDYYALATAGEYTLMSHADGLTIARTIQNNVRTWDNVAQSTPVDGAATSIVRVRMTSTQTGSISWAVSADQGWQLITPDNAWNTLSPSGDDLRWRAFLEGGGGNPSVADVHFEWLSTYATVQTVADRPNDQGGFVRATLRRSGYDFADQAQDPITNYGVWTRIDDAALIGALESVPAATVDPSIASAFAGLPLVARDGRVFVRSVARTAASATRQANATFPPGTWELVASVPALQKDDYVALIPTAADTPGHTVVVVTAHTPTPSIWYASPPDSGSSVDNIAPGVPSNLVVTYNSPGGNALAWNPSADEDFQYFRVYRGASSGFTPSSANLVHATATTGWSDPEHHDGGVHYKVTAVDHAGNESAPASPGSVTAIGDNSMPEAFALYPNVPNPFNPTTRIRYDVATGGGEVSLRIYDVSGRAVRTLVNGSQSAGRKSVQWNGRDDAGRPVASGVYFCRLVAPSYQRTNKMVLTK